MRGIRGLFERLVRLVFEMELSDMRALEKPRQINVGIEHDELINGEHNWLETYENMDINANSIIWTF